MKKFKYNLLHINLPEGWRFLKKGEKHDNSCDRFWRSLSWGKENYTEKSYGNGIVNEEYPKLHFGGSTFYGYIRRINK